MLISTLAGLGGLHGSGGSVSRVRGPGTFHLPVPTEARLGAIWRTVTPIWAVLAAGRVVYYALGVYGIRVTFRLYSPVL